MKFDAFMRSGNCAGVPQHGNAGLFHFFSGEFAKLGRDFGQDLVLGIDQVDNNIFLAEIAVKAGAAANELIDFAGDFYSAEACSHDDEAEMPTAEIGIRGGLGGFHLTNDLLAKLDGVAHDFEGEGVFAHSGNDSKIAFGAAGDRDMVVVQTRKGAAAIVKLNL